MVNVLPGNPNQYELYVLGMGHFHPENVIDNAFLTNLEIGTNDEWIVERTGILRRRTVLKLDYIVDSRNADPRLAAAASVYTNAQTGALAAKMALERAGLQPSDIGLVVAGGCSPQHTIPAEACMIASELGIEAPGYDIVSACSSFAAQLNALRNMKPETLPDYILVVNPENTTRTVDYTDRSTAVLWGDGTAATIVSPRKKGAFGVKWTTLVSDPSGWDKVSIPTGGFFHQNGSAVQAFGIRKSGEMLKALRDHVHAGHFYVGHQANLLMLQSICDRAEIPEERHLYNVDEFGNCGAAGAPSVISQRWDDFSKGDEIALVVVGSGLTWGGVALSVL